MNLASRSKTTTPSIDQNGHIKKASSPSNLVPSPSASAESATAETTEKPATTAEEEPDDLSPALESMDINVSLPTDEAAAESPAKTIQPTPKYTPNSSKPNNNPSSSSKSISAGQFGR